MECEIFCIKAPEYNISYIPIPKNCSSSIKSYMHELIFGKPFVPFKKHTGKMLHIHSFFWKDFKLNDHRETLFSKEDPEISFVVMREPIRRFISAFRNRVIAHKENTTGSASININDFINDLRANIDSLESLDHHMCPQTSWIGNDLSIFDLVYECDTAWILNRVLKKFTNTDYEFVRMQTGGPWIELGELTKKSVMTLFDYYEEDYENFKHLYTQDKLLNEYKLVKHGAK